MGSGMAIQGATRHTVLELVRRDRARTRRDLSGLTGLSRSAVAQLVSELVAEGLLTEETGDYETRPGRPATRLSLVPRHGLVGAVDIGHGHLSAALGDLHENVLDVHRERFAVERRWDVWPFTETSAEFRHRVLLALEGILATHPGQRIAIACHGGVIGVVAAAVLGITGEDMPVRAAHASYHRFGFLGPRKVVWSLNETHHLAAEDLLSY